MQTKRTSLLLQILSFRLLYDEVSDVDMQGCISLGLGFRQHPPLKFDCAHVGNSSIGWLAKRFYQDDHGGFFSVIVHSSQNFAQEYLNGNQDDLIGCLPLIDKSIIDNLLCPKKTPTFSRKTAEFLRLERCRRT